MLLDMCMLEDLFYLLLVVRVALTFMLLVELGAAQHVHASGASLIAACGGSCSYVHAVGGARCCSTCAC